MRKISISVYDEDHKLRETLIARGMDAVSSHTVIHYIEKVGKKRFNNQYQLMFVIPEQIDRWNIMDGLITIYYKNGFVIEIGRIID